MASFSIEAPAQQAISENEVSSLLSLAVSGNASSVQSATKQLQDLEKAPGYFSALQVSEDVN